METKRRRSEFIILRTYIYICIQNGDTYLVGFEFLINKEQKKIIRNKADRANN